MAKRLSRIERMFREGTPIDRAIQEGIIAALKRHRAADQYVVFERDGVPVHVRGEELDQAIADAEAHLATMVPARERVS